MFRLIISATRASIIEELIAAGYIERKKKQIVSTDYGRAFVASVSDNVKSAELTAKGVEHSAVFGGEKSAVTVAKKDSQRAFFSRGRMQRDAQRISGRGQQKPQQREQTPKKRKNQGLE